MFHFPNEVDCTLFFRFDKRLIENMNWARISPAAKAVFPVIACHCNERGDAFPGENTIAALSGLTPKSVRKGIRNDLDGFPGFNWTFYKTRYGKRGKRFNIAFPRKDIKGRTFFFHRIIIDSGIWSELTPTAHALYPAMRYFSRYEADQDENEETTDSEFIERYSQRRWELCYAEVGQLAKFAGVNRRSIADGLINLQNNFLIEPYHNECSEKIWKVYLIPKKVYKPSYLNQKLKQRGAS